ncbi:hypothetical protein SEUCBS139899_001960 [Sporothrix eucalyptigena]
MDDHDDHDVVIDVDALRTSAAQSTPYTMDPLPAAVVREAIEVETMTEPTEESSTLSPTSTSPSSVSSSPSPRIPRTSSDRLVRATPNVAPEEPVLASKYIQAPPEKTPLLSEPSPAEETVLYLAYGSNMAAATFEGTRKIKPLSAVTVSAPTLRLTFDLPGIPYREPCFANTAIRKVKPPVPIPAPPGAPGPIKPPVSTDSESRSPYGDPAWDGPLYGVVYEVTRDDYARIIATEGGGASYQDVLVPCFVVAPRMGVPEKPVVPVPVKPFLAHTLCAPMVPPSDDNTDEDGDNKNDDENDPDDGGDDSWFSRHWKAFLKWTTMRGRPNPGYAQPSKRYLGLLTTGAAEHELPQEYQDWLASLQPYTVTSWRQKVGSFLLIAASLPFLLIIVAVNWLPQKKGTTGRMSPGMMVAMGCFFKGIWWVYDNVFKPVFGDGERTQEKKEGNVRLK